MDSAAREALAGKIIALSTADETEVIVSDEASGLTRFTRNSIHQNLAEQDTAVRIRAVVGSRCGVTQTNDLSDRALEKALARAIEMAHLAPEDPSAEHLAKNAAPPAPAGAYAQQTAAATPADRAGMVRAIFDRAERDGLWAAGYVTTGRGGVTVANSRGTLSSFDETTAKLNIKQNGPDSTGYAESVANDVAALDAANAASVAAEKAVGSRSPTSVDPGEWTVIIEPAAFGELIAYLSEHFSAQSLDEGSSFLSEGFDRKVAADGVTISDDVGHPLAPAMPFDFEGTPTQRVVLIERGVAKNVVTDSLYARKLGRPNTGHALPAPNAYGPQAMHLVIEPGSKSTAELIANTKRGLLISRFWYIRTVDQRKAIVTGMTRDGTFLIEDGRVTRGVHNLRFNQSILGALEHVEFSNEQARTEGFGFSIVTPTAKIERFHFSSTTAF